MNRRYFIKNALLLSSIGPTLADYNFSTQPNAIPKWRGFNLLDFFSPDPTKSRVTTSEQYLQWIADWGFDFVRLPIAYPYYVKFDRSRPIRPDEVYQIDERQTDKIEALVHKAHKYNLHVSLNLHRAPGYCINAGFHEPYNLWKDNEALTAFSHHWGFWAKRFKHTSANLISFDLLNEPAMREDMNDQHSKVTAVPGAAYRKLVLAAQKAILKENSQHLIIADGNNVGTTVIPEITDLKVAQSCRGYHPGKISHYKAPWANKNVNNLPEPIWPGQVGNEHFNREMLEKFYEPWIALKNKGVGVHCGECGCWNKTPHPVFLAWFEDVLDILTSNGIGYSLWEFSGDFGILNSRREDIVYEDWHGHKLDRKLLTLLQKY